MSVPSTLSAHPYFRTLDAELCRVLDRQCIWLRTTAGAWIVDQSANDRDVYFIMSGQLRAVYNTARQDLIFNDMKAGSIFGEMAAIDGAPRAASVFAIVDSVVAKMPAHVFVETMFTHRPLCEAVVGTLIERLRRDVRPGQRARRAQRALPGPRRASAACAPGPRGSAAGDHRDAAEPVRARRPHQHAPGDGVARDQRHGAQRPDRAPPRRDRHQRRRCG